jgi:murein DD-endopeptidase MepM/ murein hydrolase activator NlpD
MGYKHFDKQSAYSSPSYSVNDTIAAGRRAGVDSNTGWSVGAAVAETTGATSTPLSNPPFTTSTAGKIPGAIATGPNAHHPRMFRGYIRRASVDRSDPTSRARLYFMYNPPEIVRSYVSYLDQLALDPFNTIFDSENLVLPPGILDFNFELFFDREIEAGRDRNHPGVKVDLDYFDRVVRGVDPDTADLQDTGLFMVNPRNIVVVFSPHFVVEGRAFNANVSWDKFTHRMVPTRARVGINMKAQYIGPEQADPYMMYESREVARHKATVPYQFAQISATYKNFAKDLSWDNYKSESLYSIMFASSSSDMAGGATGSVVGGAPPSVLAQGGRFIWPVASPNVFSPFGPRGGRQHQGIDISFDNNTPVYAIAGGKVISTVSHHAFNSGQIGVGGYGNQIVIDHGRLPDRITDPNSVEEINAYIEQAQGGPQFQSRYAHLNTLSVSDGQIVRQGDEIAKGNNTGSSTGPHLHFEIHVNGTPVDPVTLLPAR